MGCPTFLFFCQVAEFAIEFSLALGNNSSQYACPVIQRTHITRGSDTANISVTHGSDAANTPITRDSLTTNTPVTHGTDTANTHGTRGSDTANTHVARGSDTANTHVTWLRLENCLNCKEYFQATCDIL